MKRFDLTSDLIAGIVALLLIVAACLWVLWSTESNHANQLVALSEVEAALVGEALSDQRVVHLTGETEVDRPIEDRDLGLTVDGLLLERSVHMLQWNSFTDGDDRTAYDKDWHSRPIDSSHFPRDHQNPGAFPIHSSIFPSPGARVGDLLLPTKLIRELRQKSYTPQQSDLDISVLSELRLTWDSEHQAFFPGPHTQRQIGDLWITYEYIPLQEVSILAAAETGMVVPIQGSAGPFSMILPGHYTAEEMLAIARAERSDPMQHWRTLLFSASFVLLLIVATVLARGDERAVNNPSFYFLNAALLWLFLVGAAFGAAHFPTREGYVALATSLLAALAFVMLQVLSSRRARKFGDF